MPAGQSDFIAELAQDISKEVNGEKSARVLKADLNILSEQLVDIVFQRRTEAIANAYEAVERSFSEIVTVNGIDEAKLDALTVAAELRALTRFLGAAVQHKSPVGALSVIRENIYRPLLLQLRNSPTGLSTSDLARRLDVDASTVARKLPYLRSVDLVRSQQVGKTMMNRLTLNCEKLLQEDEALAAPNALERKAQWPQIDAGVMCIVNTAVALGHRIKVNPQLANQGVKQLELKFDIKIMFGGTQNTAALEWAGGDASRYLADEDGVILSDRDHLWSGFLDNKQDLRMGPTVLHSHEGLTCRVDAQEQKVFASLETAIFDSNLQTPISDRPGATTAMNKSPDSSYLSYAAKKRAHRQG